MGSELRLAARQTQGNDLQGFSLRDSTLSYLGALRKPLGLALRPVDLWGHFWLGDAALCFRDNDCRGNWFDNQS